MPVVRLSDSVYKRLQKYAIPFEDSVGDVVERVLDQIEGKHTQRDANYETQGSEAPEQAPETDSAVQDKSGRNGSRVRVNLPGINKKVSQGWADILIYLLNRGATSLATAITKKECKEKGDLGNTGYGELGDFGLLICVDMKEHGSWKRGDGFDAHWAFYLTEKGQEVAAKL